MTSALAQPERMLNTMNTQARLVAAVRRGLPVLALLGFAPAGAQETAQALPTPEMCSALIPAQTAPLPAPLQTALLGTLTAYQMEIRGFYEAHAGGTLTDTDRKLVQARQAARDSYLRRLLNTTGWIGSARGGAELATALGNLLLQGDDMEVQWCAGAAALTSADVNERQQGASMIDRSLIVRTGEQRYGNALELSGRTYVPLPIRDAAAVDARRAEAGLGPLADYVQKLTASLPPRPTPTGLARPVKLRPVCAAYVSEQALNRPLSSAEIDRLDDKAAALVEQDQAARTGQTGARDMGTVDAESTAWLTVMLKVFGWPSTNRADAQLAANVWLLAQHADATPSLQRCALDLITQQMSTPDEKQNFAYLTDRVRLADNQPQVYGTQVSYDEVQNRASPRLLSDPANVNRRRAAVNLGRIEDYLKLFVRPRP